MKTTTGRPPRAYHYRGLIERGCPEAGYRWREGYSEQGESGPFYPWMTRRECKSEAKRDGFQAVFFRDGKPE